jgi:hypothetical protein
MRIVCRRPVREDNKLSKSFTATVCYSAPEPGLEVVHVRTECAATSTAAQLFSGYN